MPFITSESQLKAGARLPKPYSALGTSTGEATAGPAGWALPGAALLPPHLQESPAVRCTNCFSKKRKQLVRTEMLSFGRAVWENVSPLNFMTGSNSFRRRTNVGVFLNMCCVIGTNNRKLMARYVVGQKAVPLGQAADCPHHGRIPHAGCHCWLCSGDCRKHQTPLKGPAADTRKREGTVQSQSFPMHSI